MFNLIDVKCNVMGERAAKWCVNIRCRLIRSGAIIETFLIDFPPASARLDAQWLHRGRLDWSEFHYNLSTRRFNCDFVGEPMAEWWTTIDPWLSLRSRHSRQAFNRRKIFLLNDCFATLSDKSSPASTGTFLSLQQVHSISPDGFLPRRPKQKTEKWHQQTFLLSSAICRRLFFSRPALSCRLRVDLQCKKLLSLACCRRLQCASLVLISSFGFGLKAFSISFSPAFADSPLFAHFFLLLKPSDSSAMHCLARDAHAKAKYFGRNLNNFFLFNAVKFLLCYGKHVRINNSPTQSLSQMEHRARCRKKFLASLTWLPSSGATRWFIESRLVRDSASRN